MSEDQADPQQPSQLVRSESGQADRSRQVSHLLPTDADWQPDKVLLTILTPVIAQLSAYVMRYFDADAGHGVPVSVDDERALADRVAELGTALQDRADRREALGELPATVQGDGSVAVEGEPTQPTPEPSPAMDNGP